MKIRQLVRSLPEITIRGNRELEIRGLVSDSRRVAPGDLFIARRGEKHDASQFIGQAIQAGAVAIVTDLYDPFIKQTQLICENPAHVESKLAANFYSHPSREIFAVAITGSKGKTTTSYLIQHLLNDLLGSCGLIGSIETIIGSERMASSFTTHEAIYNQKILREMVSKGCKAVSFEVSSHGLVLKRVDQISFKVGIFTNLFPDHLDFHPSLEEYAKAKKSLFSQVSEKAIFNADSSWTAFMQQGCKAPLFTFGIDEKADLMAQEIVLTPYGTRLKLKTDREEIFVETSLMGRHNVYNLLAAASVGLHMGKDLKTIAFSLSRFENVPGRLERISNSRDLQVFVDYAHTGESLENVLQSLKEIGKGKLLLLFGCGGERDPSRRLEMAAAAEKYADLTIVTSDNPRSESPEEIIRQILTGFQSREKVRIEPDRKKAIHELIQRGEKGDILLIAGKGHEKTQIFGSKSIPFDDVAIAKEALF